MAEGMEYLHQNTHYKHPIIHRDLKSSNVIVTRSNKDVKIINIGIGGLSNIQDCLLEINKTKDKNEDGGSFWYKSPEHFY